RVSRGMHADAERVVHERAHRRLELHGRRRRPGSRGGSYLLLQLVGGQLRSGGTQRRLVMTAVQSIVVAVRRQPGGKSTTKLATGSRIVWCERIVHVPLQRAQRTDADVVTFLHS